MPFPYTFWSEDSKAQLHIAVVDALGQIVGVYFDEQETLNGYYHVLHQILSNYGIPYQFFSDNRTVFEYKKSIINKAILHIILKAFLKALEKVK